VIRIGIVDLDTSHPGSWIKILREEFAARAEVVAVCDMGDVHPAGYAEQFARENKVAKVCPRPEDMVGAVDLALCCGTNWEAFPARSRPFLEAGTPTFLDKPVVGKLRDYYLIRQYAAAKKTPLMGGSSFRYAVEVEEFRAKLPELGDVKTAFAAGTGDFFNYGIHAAEMLHSAVGGGIRSVHYLGENGPAFVYIEYADGKLALLQLHSTGPAGLTVHAEKGTHSFTLDVGRVYRELIVRVLEMAETGQPAAPFDDSVEACKILIAARRSRETGRPVFLDDLTLEEGFDGPAFSAEYSARRYGR
jgi:predicted dehydrogenase